MVTHIVVAKYHEDVSWALNFAAGRSDCKLWIYDKGGGALPNQGREAETFARFFLEEYETIKPQDTIYLLQGCPFDHCPGLMKCLGQGGVEHLTPLGTMHRCDGQGRPDHPGLPIQAAHDLLEIPGQQPPRTWTFVAGAQYALPGTLVRNKPKRKWESLHTTLQQGRVCPWTMERLWPYVLA